MVTHDMDERVGHTEAEHLVSVENGEESPAFATWSSLARLLQAQDLQPLEGDANG